MVKGSRPFHRNVFENMQCFSAGNKQEVNSNSRRVFGVQEMIFEIITFCIGVFGICWCIVNVSSECPVCGCDPCDCHPNDEK